MFWGLMSITIIRGWLEEGEDGTILILAANSQTTDSTDLCG